MPLVLQELSASQDDSVAKNLKALVAAMFCAVVWDTTHEE